MLVIRTIVYLGILIVSMIFVTSSIIWDGMQINNYDQLNHVNLGFPIAFITQNQSAWEPPLPFRATYKITKTLSEFHALRYFCSVLTVVFFLIIIFEFWRRKV